MALSGPAIALIIAVLTTHIAFAVSGLFIAKRKSDQPYTWLVLLIFVYFVPFALLLWQKEPVRCPNCFQILADANVETCEHCGGALFWGMPEENETAAV